MGSMFKWGVKGADVCECGWRCGKGLTTHERGGKREREGRREKGERKERRGREKGDQFCIRGVQKELHFKNPRFHGQ